VDIEVNWREWLPRSQYVRTVVEQFVTSSEWREGKDAYENDYYGSYPVMLPDLSDPKAYYQSRLKYCCRRCRIFATESGFVGLGPNDIRIGDLVAVVFGSAVPLILRP
jgi:hypothetical protein